MATAMSSTQSGRPETRPPTMEPPEIAMMTQAQQTTTTLATRATTGRRYRPGVSEGEHGTRLADAVSRRSILRSPDARSADVVRGRYLPRLGTRSGACAPPDFRMCSSRSPPRVAPF